MVAHVQHNSGQNEWYTPSFIIEAARRAMGGIDCDPASCEQANETVQATVFYTAEANGLAQKWGVRTWMNPPYAQPLCAQFCDGMVERVHKGEVQTACVLVNNATETMWFQNLIAVADCVLFPLKRVRFVGPAGEKGAPLQGQAVIYIGDDVDAFKSAFAGLGWFADVALEQAA